MEVKEKNKKLLIVVGVLLLFGGISLAYFVSKAILGGNGGSTSATTAVINGATLNVEGVLPFEDLDILPGHKSVSSIKVTAIGNNELIPYNLIWQGTNTLTTPLNFTIYKTSEQLSITSTCSKKTKIISGAQALSEECTISNLDKLGNEIASGTINKNEAKVTLVKDEFITATSTGQTVYYYVILEYPNLNEPQNYDFEGLIDGEVTVEESNAKPDINILAAYIEEDGTYKEVEDIPQEGYQLNTEKSTCSNGTIPNWDIRTHTFSTSNLTKSGTSCYLYFYEDMATKKIKELGLTYSLYVPDFSKSATTDEGIFITEDGMYGETSYYWRGAATTNYVKFANYCWRIIRINGDGSIRVLYDGNTCHNNGEVTTDSIILKNTPYNPTYDNNSYIGWSYEIGKQRPSNVESGTPAPLKTSLELWYNNNITDKSKVAVGKFCNDRNTQNNEAWKETEVQFYAANDRVANESPSLSCSTGDTYLLNVGMITSDELQLAGINNSENNISSYLCNGQFYWTMTPNFSASSTRYMYAFYDKGNIGVADLYWTGAGVRPVINLRSDITFSDGDGTKDNPYIVAN